ncbi:MAG: hypothetical protein WCE44_08900, partial [Candidatus Velthaea sp.]
DDEIGFALAERLTELMRDCGMPAGLAALGYDAGDVTRLVAGTVPQVRLLSNAPIPVDAAVLTRLFSAALAA